MSHRAELWFLGVAILGLTIPVAQAQSSVTVKIETTHGALVSGAKVALQYFGTDEHNYNVITDVFDMSEKETAHYSQDRLAKGFYVLFACDDGLMYEPDLSARFQLGADDHKKAETLVLKDGPRIVRPPFKGMTMAKGAPVCVIHRRSGCKVTREIDTGGNITVRGSWVDYDFEPQACPQEKRLGP